MPTDSDAPPAAPVVRAMRSFAVASPAVPLRAVQRAFAVATPAAVTISVHNAVNVGTDPPVPSVAKSATRHVTPLSSSFHVHKTTKLAAPPLDLDAAVHRVVTVTPPADGVSQLPRAKSLTVSLVRQSRRVGVDLPALGGTEASGAPIALPRFEIVEQPAFGTVVLNEASGVPVYTPHDPTRIGADSFTYVVRNGLGDESTPASVRLFVRSPVHMVVRGDTGRATVRRGVAGRRTRLVVGSRSVRTLSAAAAA